MPYLCLLILTFSSPALAKESERIEKLEAQLKTLSARVETLEGQLKQVQKGGFTIVPVVNCEIITPFDGTFNASELSKTAATNSVVEKCKAKASNQSDCASKHVVCK